MKENNSEDQSVQLQIESLNAVTAAPEHHKVVFENGRVRIVDFRVKPGETVSVHTHRQAAINYISIVSEISAALK